MKAYVFVATADFLDVSPHRSRNFLLSRRPFELLGRSWWRSTSEQDIVPLRAKLRFSTLICPSADDEEILDFTTGDNEFWIINGAHNLCYVHPAQAGIRSNLNLITASGHVYSFLLTEISSEPNTQPDLKLSSNQRKIPASRHGLARLRRATDAEAYRKNSNRFASRPPNKFTLPLPTCGRRKTISARHKPRTPFRLRPRSEGLRGAVPGHRDLPRRFVYLHPVCGA